MEAVLLVIHLIVACGIIILVLLQPSEAGGFLGNSGTMSNLMAPRRSADIMTRMTTIFAAIFFTTSLLLAIVAQNRPERQSIIDLVKEDGKPAIEKSANTTADEGGKKDKTDEPAPVKEPPADENPDEDAPVKEPGTPKAPISK